MRSKQLFSLSALLFLIMPITSSAKQLYFQKTPSQENTHFQYQWSTATKEKQKVSFSLSTELLTTEDQFPIHKPLKQVLEVQRDAVNEWAKLQTGVSVLAELSSSNSISIELSGTDQALMSQKYQEAIQVREQAENEFLRKTGFQLINDEILPDFTILIHEYSIKLAPIAKNLKQPDDNLNSYAKRALAFVQNIPYEKSQKDTFRRPVSILKNNKGDCDSKTVLYLALIKAAYPNTPVAVVDIPEHAFVLIGAKGLDTTMEVEINEQIWVPIEPVGPGLAPFGELRPESLQHFQAGNFRLFIAD